MRILIAGGQVIDPASDLDRPADLVVEGGRLAEIGNPGSFGGRERSGFDRVIEAAGLIVAPGLVDIHCHLREPGFEYKENIESGTRAAAAGGFTAVACMPNTKPVTDSRSVVEYILGRAREAGSAAVYPIAAITKGSEGKELTEMAELREAGAVAVSDDGRPVENAEVMRLALEYAKMFGLPVISHAEEKSLAGDGVMNLGRVSTVLGLRGIPNAAEDVMAARDLILAEMTGAHLHLAHVSTRGTVELIRAAKSRGVNVTAEATPHHFTLTDEAVREMDYDSSTKVNPPLRSAEDREAVIQGLADGTIDCIATDHAPHHFDEKEQEYNYAPFGISGLETALGLTVTNLVRPGRISLKQALAKLCAAPAKTLGIPKGALRRGGPADIIILDIKHEYTVEANKYKSKGRNTPFDGWRLFGRAAVTIAEGRIVHEQGAGPEGETL